MSRDRTDAGAETATLLLCLRAARSFRFIASVPPASSDVPLRQFAGMVAARQRRPFQLTGDAPDRVLEHEKTRRGWAAGVVTWRMRLVRGSASRGPSLADPAEAA